MKNVFEPPAFQAQVIVAKAFQIKEAPRRLTMSVCHAPPFCGQCASLVTRVATLSARSLHCSAFISLRLLK